ncbi:hypothetical protein ACFXPJ_32935 [Streptomyces goshikiensis]
MLSDDTRYSDDTMDPLLSREMSLVDPADIVHGRAYVVEVLLECIIRKIADPSPEMTRISSPTPGLYRACECAGITLPERKPPPYSPNCIRRHAVPDIPKGKFKELEEIDLPVALGVDVIDDGIETPGLFLAFRNEEREQLVEGDEASRFLSSILSRP